MDEKRGRPTRRRSNFNCERLWTSNRSIMAKSSRTFIILISGHLRVSLWLITRLHCYEIGLPPVRFMLFIVSLYS